MRLIKRVTSDIRGPDQCDQDTENDINEVLMKLQTNQAGARNPNVEIIDVKDVTKDSSIQIFTILYDDKGLDSKPEE